MKELFYILDFIYYKAAKIYAKFKLGPIGPNKFYTGAHPDTIVSLIVFGVTLFIPLNIYNYIFRYVLDVQVFVIGMFVVFGLYSFLILIPLQHRYERIPIDSLKLKYEDSWLDRHVTNFAIIPIAIVLTIGGIFFAFFHIFCHAPMKRRRNMPMDSNFQPLPMLRLS